MQDLIVYLEGISDTGEMIDIPCAGLSQTNSSKSYFYPLGTLREGTMSFRKLVTVDSRVSRVRVTLSIWRNRNNLIFEVPYFAVKMHNALIMVDAAGSNPFANLLAGLMQSGLSPDGRVLDIAGAPPEPERTVGALVAAFRQPIHCISLPASQDRPWLDTRRLLDGCQIEPGPSGHYALICLHPHLLAMPALFNKTVELCEILDRKGMIILSASADAIDSLSQPATPPEPSRRAIALNAAFLERLIPLEVIALLPATAEPVSDQNWVALRKTRLERDFPSLYALLRDKDYAAAAELMYEALLPVALGEAGIQPHPQIAQMLREAAVPLDRGGKYEEAFKCFLCAIALDSETAAQKVELAAKFRVRRDFKTAGKILDRFLYDHPDDLGGIINLALLYSEIGRGLEAMEMAEQYLMRAGRRITIPMRRTITSLLRNFARECQSAGHDTSLAVPLLAPEIGATYLADPEAFARKWHQPRLTRLFHQDAVERRSKRDEALRRVDPPPADRKLRILITSVGAWAFVLKMIKQLDLREEDVEYRTFDFEYLEEAIRKDHLHEVFAPVSLGCDPAAIWKRVVADQNALGDLVDWCDVVFCEWAGFPAVWLSRFLPAEKKLVIRLHSYEAFSAWPFFINWGGIDGIVFVADHIRRFADIQFRYSAHCDHSIVLQNFNDPSAFSTEKALGAERVLGMLGYSNLNKDPLFAAQVLEKLRRTDKSWRLRLVGSPWDEARLNDAELEYFRGFEKFVSDHHLEGAIDYVGFTRDINEALSRIGFILSCSHREGTHEAILEGMASGSVPVIRRWPMVRNLGAPETSYPGLTYADTDDEAVGMVLAAAEPERFRVASAAAVDYVRRQFNPMDAMDGFVEFLGKIVAKRNMQ